MPTSSWSPPADYTNLDENDDTSMVSVDRIRLSEELVEEIVLLAGASWMVWVTNEGEIVAAQKGPVA